MRRGRADQGELWLRATTFNEIAQIGLLLAIYLSGLAMFLVAASFIGAEFTTGAIANWLSFVPRRVPVFASVDHRGYIRAFGECARLRHCPGHGGAAHLSARR